MSPLATGTKKRSPRGASGFTLIELIIVMSMMVVLAGVVAPRLQVSPSRQVEGMARQMVAHLELARSNALGRRQMTQIVFDEAARTYTAYVDHDRDGNITQVDAEVNAFADFGERDLERTVEFGRGNASPIPGDESTLAVTLTRPKLMLGCGFGGGGSGERQSGGDGEPGAGDQRADVLPVAPGVRGDEGGSSSTLQGAGEGERTAEASGGDLSAQGVPEPWGTMGTVYLVHRDDKEAVAAISFASSGSFKAWRWSPGGAQWR